MPNKIKVRCHPNGHVNVVDIEKALRPDIVVKASPGITADHIPARIILPCTDCAEGKVILTREMIEQNQRD